MGKPPQPRNLEEWEVKRIKELIELEVPVKIIATRLGRTPQTIRNALRRETGNAS